MLGSNDRPNPHEVVQFVLLRLDLSLNRLRQATTLTNLRRFRHANGADFLRRVEGLSNHTHRLGRWRDGLLRHSFSPSSYLAALLPVHPSGSLDSFNCLTVFAQSPHRVGE